MNKSLLLLSGGVDSVVLAHKLSSSGEPFNALFFDTAKECSIRELEFSRYTAVAQSARHDVVDIRSMSRSFIGYASAKFIMLDELDRGGDTHITGGNPGGLKAASAAVAPSGFPILLSIASFFAQISGHTDIYCGITKEQADAIPTTREFFDGWGAALALLNGSAYPISVHAPFIGLTKAEIIRLGHELRVPLELSWSCMLKTINHCGKCPRCVERKAAFKAAQVKDPTVYL